MAPVSVLPGRLRLECEAIRNRREICSALENRIHNCAGVVEVVASFRTGRILVRFDEQIVDSVRLAGQIESLLSAPAPAGEKAPAVHARVSSPAGAVSGQVARHLFFDLVAHAVLPGPLALLVPAVSVLRR
ncbi:HMA2 domain-containing protein [Desulfuromonas sp. TF]|uniref:HMA2 domain-containing protein n=1 Tax=Desulfuromonas sp. TF TaxID=1232410 RepID=UPI0004130BC5|nr:hypothetical protein [Desulfuromonas sp. TF]